MPSGGFTAIGKHVQPTVEATQAKRRKKRKENAGEGEDLASRNKCHELTQIKLHFKTSVLTGMISTYTAGNPRSQPKDIKQHYRAILPQGQNVLEQFLQCIRHKQVFPQN